MLDGLRAFAVIAVFARHAWGLAGSPAVTLPSRWIGLPDVDLTPFVVMCSNGVDLFFVLSGYLLARSFLTADLDGRPAPSLRRYTRTRLYRVLPGYWFSLAALVLIFLPALSDEKAVFSVHGALAVLGHIPVLQTVFTFSYGVWGPGSPYWTLTLEILFYLSLPWAVRLFYGRRAPWALLGSLMLTLGWLTMARFWFAGAMSWIADHSARDGASPAFVRFWLGKQLPGYAFSFGVGIFVAKVTLLLARRTRPVPTWLAPASFLCGLATVAYSMRWLGLRTLQGTFYDALVLINTNSFEAKMFYYLEGTSMAVGFGLIVFGLVLGQRSAWSAPFRMSGLRLVGLLGFGIYLWHMPFLYLYTRLPFLGRMSPMGHWWALMGLAGVAVLAVSMLSFFVIEKPMILRGRRSSNGGQPTGAETATVSAPG